MKKESYIMFKHRIRKEGYYIRSLYWTNGKGVYSITTPNGRTFQGYLDEVKECIGE